jgi:hypothetical protein
MILEEEDANSVLGTVFYVKNLKTDKKHPFYFHNRTSKYISHYNFFSELLTEDLEGLKKSINLLSEVDREGIEKGTLLKGMNKEGVRVAIGNPPIFANPTPNSAKKWNYWYAKKVQFSVEFDEHDLVIHVSGGHPSLVF